MVNRYLYCLRPDRIGLYDSELDNTHYSDHNNLDLTITLKVFLNPINDGETTVHDVDNTPFRIDNWPIGTWNKFSTTYQTTGEQFWDKKFWLRAPSNFIEFSRERGTSRNERIMIPRTEDFGIRYARVFCHPDTRAHQEPIFLPRGLSRQPNLNCRFKLELVHSKGEAHKIIDVYYITHRRLGNRWVLIRPGENPGFRSTDRTYDSGDLIGTQRILGGRRITRYTHLHEIAHAIGLEHAGVARSEKECIQVIHSQGMGTGSNNSLCYGNTPESESDVSGRGIDFSWYDSLPWRYAAQQHTGIRMNYWEAYLNPIPASVLNLR